MSPNCNFSIGLVYFSGKTQLITAVQDLISQEYTEKFEILIKDHSENHEAKKCIEDTFYTEIHSKKIQIWGGENTMHSGGHNEIFLKKIYQYYIVASIDMRYPKNMLSMFSQAIQKYPGAAIWGGKILQADTNYIDSVGIEKKWYGVYAERGFGEKADAYENDEEVFGISGALFCIDTNALEKNEFLFENSIHYKNDGELMQRMQQKNKKVQYFSQVLGTHNRYINKNIKKSLWVLQSSFKGQLFIYKKSYWYEKIPMSFVILAQWIRMQWRKIKDREKV